MNILSIECPRDLTILVGSFSGVLDLQAIVAWTVVAGGGLACSLLEVGGGGGGVRSTDLQLRRRAVSLKDVLPLLRGRDVLPPLRGRDLLVCVCEYECLSV
jgi:hypothetical protein